MTINDNILDTIRKRSEELTKQINLASELLRTAQDRFGETEMTVERKKGGKVKHIQAKQKDLWQEVNELGLKCEAGKALREKHPQVFEAYDEYFKIVQDLNNFVMANLGISGYQKVSLTEIINLAEGISEWKMRKMLKKDCFESVEINVGDKKDKK